ncbi:PilC/PilY family type IV pilus protein [Salinicola sp. CPA57]|uniref:PilC/PilY family type IV pilus protein n=1 Tax=Salinicola sp. CPA57 TaxID=1949080 RepID=UPI000DA192CF|nr:PilC/PilY family type IV pilus protein [Salinicola sp. CPA57]
MRIVLRGLPILLLAAVACVAGADDTDIYRSLYDIEERGGNPQVMILFDTSGSMRDVIPGQQGNQTKIAVARSVVDSLVRDNPKVNFGLSIFNYNGPSPDGGRIIFPLPGEGLDSSDQQQVALLDTLHNLDPRTSTPLCEAYYEVYRYFAGQAPWNGTRRREGADLNPTYADSAIANGRYRSPLRPCEPIYVIYMTDGVPQNDTEANSSITRLVAGSEFYRGCGRYDALDSQARRTVSRNCMPELAEYMQQLQTFSDGELARGPVTTYTIGFDTDQQLLADTASPLNVDSDSCPVARQDTRYHGIGACVGYFTATNAEQLYTAFQVAIDDVLSRSTTFSAPAVSAAFTSNTQSFDRLYLPRFLPRNTPRWSGNLKRLRFVAQDSWTDRLGRDAFNASTGDILDTASTWWSDRLDLDEPDGNTVEAGGVGGLLRQTVDRALRTTDHDGRQIVTDVEGALVDFRAGEGWMRDPAAWGLAAETPAAALATLIDWSRGRDTEDEDGDGNRQEARPWLLGDILHSDPIALNYGGESQDAEKLYLAFGTNAGYLHFVDGDTGDEQWAFTPRALGPLHAVLRENREVISSDETLQHPYGIDGPPAYVRIDANGDGRIRASDGDRVILAFGLRRGGDRYYAIDVSDPLAPRLAWEIEPKGDFAELGQSWAAPIPTRVPGHANPVFVITGGYDTGRDDPTRDANDPDAMGRAVYIVDALDGSLVYRADASMPERFIGDGIFGHAMPAAPEVVDIDSDGVADRIYLADVGGNLWRLDLDPTVSADAWHILQVAKLGGSGRNNRRFFNSVDFVSQVAGGRRQALLLIGSGDRANPKSGGEGGRGAPVRDAFFAIRDAVSDAQFSTDEPVKPVDPDQLVDVTNDAYCSHDRSDRDRLCADVWAREAGWIMYLDNGYALPLPGAKVLSESVTINGVTYFSAYVPEVPTSICVPVIGRSYLFGLALLTAHGARRVNLPDDRLDRNTRAVEAGEYLLGRPSLIVRDGELFLQGIGTANLAQLVGEDARGDAGGLALPYRTRRTYWYEMEEPSP